jgi:hypothetical protein
VVIVRAHTSPQQVYAGHNVSLSKPSCPPRALPAVLHGTPMTATFANNTGAYYVWLPSADLMYTQGVGHISADCARDLCELAVQRLSASPRAAYFHDWAEVTGYETKARHIITTWAFQQNNTERIVVLTRSQLLAMGVSAFELALEALGRRVPVRACTSRPEFVADLMSYLGKV